MKVLLADDSQPIRERMAERLSRLTGIQVAEAVDTPDAIRQMAIFMPDVAVLDIRMPGGGGLAALEEIKKIKPCTTVIIMTNYPYAQYRRKCLDAGADFFFDKSTEFELVPETIQTLLENGNVDAVAHYTATAQLVAAKEQLEKATQRHCDMGILSLLQKSSVRDCKEQTYGMWEKTFDAMPDMVAIIDAEHSIVRVNKAMADRLSLPAAELAGKKCFEYCHGTNCPVDGCAYEEMLLDLKEHDVEVYESRLGGWIHVTVSPVFENGRLIGAIHIARDINARKLAEISLHESESRYRQLFESMQSGFALHKIICDKNGRPCDYRFLEVNPAFEKLTGLKAVDIIGKTVREVMPSIEDRWVEIYGKVSLTGEAIQFDNFSVELGRYYSVAAYSPGEGLFATVIEDVTDQKNAEEAVRRARDVAEESNRIKTQFLANMSHELRTPLNAIIGFSEILLDTPLNEEQLDYIKTISRSGDALLSIIADLLDLSKIEMGKLKIKNETFAIRSVVQQSVALVSAFAGEKGVDLSADVADDVPEAVTGDADRLQQVLVNLLNNAIKFTNQGFVRLMVKTRILPSGSRQLCFSVKDSGKGMSSEVMSRIFQPFQQGDNSDTREYGGSGLGLAICKNLVKMMGGSIRVESREGEGSLFTFHIQDRSALQTHFSINEVRDQWRGRTVCVWTDDPADMRTAEVLLERVGAMPRYKTSIDEIKTCLTLDVPADVVLCNLDIPGLTEHIVEFRKIRPDVPWIAFSDWVKTVDEQMKSCCSAFIDRPLAEDQLYGALMSLPESEA